MSTPPSPNPLNYQPQTGFSATTYFTQTVAIFIDAYRDLQSKKLFWIVLSLSAIVGLAMACVGINPNGVSILWWTIPLGFWNSNTLPPNLFYKYIFATYAVNIWLGLAATILALISTASIFPDFVSSGAVDLYLSRPLGRLRLFVTKYLSGLTFAALQVTIFTVCAFFAVGIRGGVWEVGMFLAIPIVVLFFSFLFAVSTLVGVMTRSTIAAVLLTCLAWFLFFSVNTAESAVLTFRRFAESEVVRRDGAVQRMDRLLATTRTKDFEFQRDVAIKGREEQEATVDKLRLAHNILFAVKFPLPKTGETMDLLRRTLASYGDFPTEVIEEDEDDAAALLGPPSTNPTDRRRRNRAHRERMDQTAREVADSRSVPYILGTSIGFEFVVLGLAALVFCKRDY